MADLRPLWTSIYVICAQQIFYESFHNVSTSNIWQVAKPLLLEKMCVFMGGCPEKCNFNQIKNSRFASIIDFNMDNI